MGKVLANIWWNLKRTWPDILALLSVLGLLFFVPTEVLLSENPKLGLISIFIGKLMFISAGILHAHVTRKLIWNYIDFNEETDIWKKIMIIAWYVTIIFCWARGG